MSVHEGAGTLTRPAAVRSDGEGTSGAREVVGALVTGEVLITGGTLVAVCVIAGRGTETAGPAASGVAATGRPPPAVSAGRWTAAQGGC